MHGKIHKRQFVVEQHSNGIDSKDSSEYLHIDQNHLYNRRTATLDSQRSITPSDIDMPPSSLRRNRDIIVAKYGMPRSHEVANSKKKHEVVQNFLKTDVSKKIKF